MELIMLLVNKYNFYYFEIEINYFILNFFINKLVF